MKRKSKGRTDLYILTSFIFIRYYHFNPIFLNFLEQEGIVVLVLSDNIDRATQKGFKVCFQTDYQEKLRGHFYIDIYIAAFVVLVSCLPLFSFLISFFKRLLPLQGARRIALIPRVLPWARSFWVFSPCLNHMQN